MSSLLDDKAIEWVVRLNAFDLDETTLLAFQKWYTENNQHANALKNAIQLWLDMGLSIQEKTTNSATLPLK